MKNKNQSIRWVIIGFAILIPVLIFCNHHNWSMNAIGLSILSQLKKIKGEAVDLAAIKSVNSPVNSHSTWTELLQGHVDSHGNVNYRGFISDSLDFNQYLDQLSSHPPGKNWSEAEQLAYWINAYNAFTIKLIVDNYPLKSIKDISDGLPMINSPWDIKFFQIGGVDFDLNTIEHEILRKHFDEPRIHFAINCASVSCPKLRNEAYTAEQLEVQLENQAIDFLNDSNRNTITAETTQLSKIFDWFGNDFIKKEDLLTYIRKYNPLINSKSRVEYLDYNWGLNDDYILLYLDVPIPGDTPMIFAPNIVSKKDESEFGSIFSRDGREFFYGVDLGDRSEIRRVIWRDHQWSVPEVIISDSIYGYNDPMLSPDEQRLYYISKMPRNVMDTIKDYDIWYSERIESGWSAPINAGPNINSDHDEYYISFNQQGDMYFSSNKAEAPDRRHDFDIYKSEFLNSEFRKPTRLDTSINSRGYEADVFISPDESYIIFCAARRSGYGRGDLYISFKNEDGSWTPSINMGVPINSENHELCPWVTHDGKYLFYTSRQDIYWVSTTAIEKLKE